MHPTGRALYVANDADGSLQYQSFISAYAINTATGALTAIGAVTFPGYPSHVTVDPSGRFVYLTSDGPSQISAYSVNQTTGELSETAESPFATARNPEDISVVPFGKFAYRAGSFGIFGYNVNATTGALSEIAGGPFAASGWVTLHPSGKFAYGLEVDSNYALFLDTLAINASTGELTKVAATSAPEGPTVIGISPSGKFGYTPNSGPDDVSVYTIDATTGVLTRSGPNVAAGNNPNAIATTRARP
jgi:6-phosphogluconolactonase (cycloisomerase 2 family)